MPSIGSTTQVTAPSTAVPPPSSPTTGSPGRSCASRSRTSVSSAVSEAVTTSVGVLFVDTPARRGGRIRALLPRPGQGVQVRGGLGDDTFRDPPQAIRDRRTPGAAGPGT